MDKKKIFLWFFIGMLTGAVLYKVGFHYCRFYKHDGWSRFEKGMDKGFKPEKILNKLNRELNLSSDQKGKIEKILEANLTKFRELKEKIFPQFEDMRKATQSEIRKILNEDQAVKYDQMIKKMEERKEKWKKKFETR